MDPEQDRLDLELLDRITARDRAAFAELYGRYQAAAYGLARRVTGSEQLAQEVLQDAFLAVWRAPEAFDPARGSFRTFFLSLVHHRGVDAVRREERIHRRAEREANRTREEDEDPAEGVVEDAWLDVRRKQVRDALRLLPRDQRTVLELAYFGGMTQTRVAETLGIPLGTVKTRTFAAMQKLRSALALEEDA